MNIKFNDGIGSRGIRHMNLLVASACDKQVIFPFQGKSIPGVAQIESSSYERNGKWSSTTWSVNLAEGIEGFTWSQDWEQGNYLGVSWTQTISRVQEAARSCAQTLTREAVERFIRATFKAEDVARLDEAEGVLRQPSGQILAELLAAQEERASANRELDAVAADIAAIEQAQADRQAAAELRERATKARAAMAKGATLADLKTLLAG